MIEVEVFGARGDPELPSSREITRLCMRTAARVGIEEGHVAVEFVDAERIAELNARHRNRDVPTDVLSFPIDGVESISDGVESGPDRIQSVPRARALDEEVSGGRSVPPVPRELGDIVICPEHTVDVHEAVVHGMLHLLGMDHESDDGEMLAVQRELLGAADGG